MVMSGQSVILTVNHTFPVLIISRVTVKECAGPVNVICIFLNTRLDWLLPTVLTGPAHLIGQATLRRALIMVRGQTKEAV